jgi:pSer/pThr/pTyr-binding forkhead associated (FHA) protein
MPPKLRFDIHEADTSITVSAAYSLLIGRYNRQRPVDIDLTDYDGVRYGISRQHIEIIPKQDLQRLLVKDLDTANGSHINGQPMTPGHLYMLQDGDELKLGAMHITVHFVHNDPPPH